MREYSGPWTDSYKETTLNIKRKMLDTQSERNAKMSREKQGSKAPDGRLKLCSILPRAFDVP